RGALFRQESEGVPYPPAPSFDRKMGVSDTFPRPLSTGNRRYRIPACVLSRQELGGIGYLLHPVSTATRRYPTPSHGPSRRLRGFPKCVGAESPPMKGVNLALIP